MSRIIGVTVGTPTSPAKMEQELKPVKTVNGVAPDESGNVGVTPEQIGAAPAGYGLGTQNEVVISSLSELDNTWRNGWYKFQTFNEENIEGHKLGLLYVNSSTSSVEQIFVPYRNPYRLIRVNHAEDGWGVWEYENPPMVLGVEYRTTERWQNKPVYTMLVDCGTMPNKSQKLVNFNKDSTRALRCIGFTDDGGTFPSFTYGNRIDVMAHTGTIIINTDYDVSAYTALAQVWYLKD